MKTPEIIKVLKNTRDYENLREILGNDLGQLIYDLVDASQSKPEEIEFVKSKDQDGDDLISWKTLSGLYNIIIHNESIGVSFIPFDSNQKSQLIHHDFIKPEEIDVKNAMLHVFDNFNNNLSRNEVEKRIDDYLAYQTRIKPVDTKTVDAVDATFWRRLEMFVSNIQVNDMAGEEEKQYIIHVIESKK